MLDVVFHGAFAAGFAEGFEELVGMPCRIATVSDAVGTDDERTAYANATCIIGTRFHADLPHPRRLALFQVPGAGHDGIDFSLLPGEAIACNCFGHETAIAEYVLGAILRDTIPFEDADCRLRRGDWSLTARDRSTVHREIAGSTLGILGFGRIGQAVAKRARAFDMRISVANRTAPAQDAPVDEWRPLAAIDQFWPVVDYLVVSLPLLPETRGIVDRQAFAAMQPDAMIINVGRGQTIDEQALFEALRDRKIRSAAIDTWYVYPDGDKPTPLPGHQPFQELQSILMTPHMSGWTSGTLRRRQRAMAENVRRIAEGRPCVNVIGRAGQSAGAAGRR